MHPLKKAARIAGAVYLSMVVTGPFSLIYIFQYTQQYRRADSLPRRGFPCGLR